MSARTLETLFDALPPTDAVLVDVGPRGHGVFDHVEAVDVLVGPFRVGRTSGLRWNMIDSTYINTIGAGLLPPDLGALVSSWFSLLPSGELVPVGSGEAQETDEDLHQEPAEAEVDRQTGDTIGAAAGDPEADPDGNPDDDDDEEPPIAVARLLRRILRSQNAASIFLALLVAGEAGREELVRTSRLSLSTVKRGLRVLRAAGAITRTQRPGQRAVFRVRSGLWRPGSQVGQAARRSGR